MCAGIVCTGTYKLLLYKKTGLSYSCWRAVLQQ